MAKQTIAIGSTPNDGTGSTIRAGGDLINDNFNEIYTTFGDGTNLSSGVITGKIAGTNFSNSMIVGHATTGTLNNANHNTSIGLAAMDAITSGNRNTVLGYQAATSLQDGEDNIAIGKDSMQNAVGPSGNVAIGTNSLNANISSVDNTAVGHEAGKLVTGRNNTFLGAEAGNNVTTGSGNVLIGSTQADSATGDRQLEIAGNDGTTHTIWLKGDNTGEVTVFGNPTQNLGIATKQYVDAQIATEDTIAEMNDVTLTSIASGDILQWNGSAFVNTALGTIGTMAAQNANAVAITGGSITMGALSNTSTLLVKNSSGTTLKTIIGTTS